jgi:hypothetical protein
MQFGILPLKVTAEHLYAVLRNKIQKILLQKKVMLLLSSWLGNLPNFSSKGVVKSGHFRRSQYRQIFAGIGIWSPEYRYSGIGIYRIGNTSSNVHTHAVLEPATAARRQLSGRRPVALKSGQCSLVMQTGSHFCIGSLGSRG